MLNIARPFAGFDNAACSSDVILGNKNPLVFDFNSKSAEVSGTSVPIPIWAWATAESKSNAAIIFWFFFIFYCTLIAVSVLLPISILSDPVFHLTSIGCPEPTDTMACKETLEVLGPELSVFMELGIFAPLR